MSKRQRSHGSKFCQIRSREACDGNSSAVSCLLRERWQQSIALCHQKLSYAPAARGSTDSSPQEERVGGLFSMER